VKQRRVVVGSVYKAAADRHMDGVGAGAIVGAAFVGVV
jgi:hypothetical protein